MSKRICAFHMAPKCFSSPGSYDRKSPVFADAAIACEHDGLVPTESCSSKQCA